MLRDEKNRDVLMDMYRKQYPKDVAILSMPSGEFLISNEDDTFSVIEPHEGETSETFIDRLKRSKECGRNLFYEEWEPFEYEDGCLY